MKYYYLLLVIVLFFGCDTKSEESDSNSTKHEIDKVSWNIIDSIDLDDFNEDLEQGKLTLDIGVYFPSNLDSAFDKVTLSQLVESLEAAKEIYAPVDVQINLLWVKEGQLNPKYLAIQANKAPSVPQTEYVNMYQHMKRHPSELTPLAKDAFKSIIEPNQNNHRTVYLVVLQDVFFPFLEVSEGRNWVVKSVRTGGLSFPSYSYVDNIPSEYRGVITLTNLSRPDRLRSTIAHEIGHKLINVSHEYKETNPGHEVYADGGLMLYGDGEDIPSGREGRWHLERLHLSPFLYQLNNDGSKIWNDDYIQGGHYYDPIYGDYAVNFDGVPPIDEDW